MSADDATARWLDEQLDLALANPGALPEDLAGTELGEVVQLFAADAAALASEQMADANGVRRRLLEQVGDEQQAASGIGFVESVLRGTGRGAGIGARGAGWSAGRAWRARRVVMVAGCMVVVCTTLAYADTRTPAGRIMRTAARTLQIPVPAEPKSAAERRADQQARDGREAAAGDDRRGAGAGRGGAARGDDATGPDARGGGEPVDAVPGELGEDGEFLPGGDQPFDGSGPRADGDLQPKPGQQVPPDDGATQPQPNPDGSVPPPPGGQQPPIGQQPPPPGGAGPAPGAPRPGGTQPPAPKPAGPAPQPGTQPPPMQPRPPQPAPQPQPQPAPRPQPQPAP